MKTLIIIPIKNAYDSILDIIANIEISAPGVDYLVVDRGSTDRSKHLLNNNNINRLELAIDMSYNSALELGIEYAYKNKFDVCIQLDQTQSLDDKDIKYFIRTYQNTKKDIILGSRFVEKKMPWKPRYWMAHILRSTIRVMTRKKISDPYLRFKLINRKVMKEVMNHPEWSLDVDSIANLIRVGYTYKEIQVNINNKKIRQSGLKRLKLFRYVWYKILSIILVQPFRINKGKEV